MTNPAEGYESFMVPTLFGPWAAELVRIADPKPGERVLDVGCGTGIVARQVASRFGASGAVTGVDSSPDMLAVAKAAAARQGAAIEWRVGNAEQLPFLERSFDLVLCQFALMFFTDRVAALREMRRVVTDQGRVLLSVWQGLDRHPFYQTLHNVIERRFGMSGVQEIFALGSEDEVRGLIMAAGFQQARIESMTLTARFPNPDGFLAGEIDVDTASIPSMQHLDDEARQAAVAAISADMQEPLRAVTQNDEVVLPFHARIVMVGR
jgi:ubiquinone/menaquinone biosynthesis C-methylase UbiE